MLTGRLTMAIYSPPIRNGNGPMIWRWHPRPTRRATDRRASRRPSEPGRVCAHRDYRRDGIVLRGAKAIVTGALYARAAGDASAT